MMIAAANTIDYRFVFRGTFSSIIGCMIRKAGGMIDGVRFANAQSGVDECVRLYGALVKKAKNLDRVINIVKKEEFGAVMPHFELNDEPSNDVLINVNNVLNYIPVEPRTMFISDTQTLFCGMDDPINKEIAGFKYSLKAAVTSIINRDDTFYLATLVYFVKPFVELIRADPELSVLLESGDIAIGLKGSRNLGFVLRSLLKEEDAYFAKYGLGGDNDMEVYINPELGDNRYKDIKAKLFKLVHKLAPGFIDELLGLFTLFHPSSTLLVTADAPGTPFLGPTQLRLKPTKSYVMNRFNPTVSLKKDLPIDPNIIFYRETTNVFPQEGTGDMCDFTLGRFMLNYEFDIPFSACGRRQTGKAEILDFVIGNLRDSLLSKSYGKALEKPVATVTLENFDGNG
jgi:hypothetical protein